jgi:peptidoglycan/LPS O-acetylase OafA/YrhL
MTTKSLKTASTFGNVRERHPELDILRGIAILFILGRHVLYIPENLPIFFKNFLSLWQQAGWIGVDLFFVLSGFLVSGLLFAEQKNTGKIRISRFLIRRAFKIYPSFYLFLIVSIVTSYAFQLPSTPKPHAFVGEALFLQNYIGQFWPHTWSLAVEEHFYLVLTFIIATLIRNQPTKVNPFRFLQTIIASVACLLLILRVIISFRYPSGEWLATLVYTHLRIDSLFFGVWLAYLYHFKSQILVSLVRRHTLLLVLITCLTLTTPLLFHLDNSRFMYSLGFTLLYIGFGALLLLSLICTFANKHVILKQLSPIARLGQRSYSIYLWHMMAYALSVKICSPHTSLAAFSTQITLYFFGSIVIGSLAASMIEFPVLRIRERYFSTSS